MNPDRESAETRARARVYLAGGHRTVWRETVKSLAPGLEHVDPSRHQLHEPAQYVAWDLAAIRSCDILFAYFEATNPSGYALSAEMGYAKAHGKTVIFVDGKSATSEDAARYLQFLHHLADASFTDLEEGARFLSSFSKLR